MSENGLFDDVAVVDERGPASRISGSGHPDPVHRVETTKVCVIFASAGRPQVLSEVVATMTSQTLRPNSVIVCCPTPADAGTAGALDGVEVVIAPRGLAVQRNAALARVPADTDVVAFFDDDFLAHPGWIEAAVGTFCNDKTVAAVTGDLIEDDVRGREVSVERATLLLQRAPVAAPTWIERNCTPYGCNMAFRRSMIGGLRFDERLALYAWLEDRDFGAAVAKRGATVKIGSARGVHMQAGSGRISGAKLGYAQVINPLYLGRKGTMPPREAVAQVVRDVASNAMRSFRPEPHIDRVGRLRGNLKGLADLMTGRLAPERVATV